MYSLAIEVVGMNLISDHSIIIQMRESMFSLVNTCQRNLNFKSVNLHSMKCTHSSHYITFTTLSHLNKNENLLNVYLQCHININSCNNICVCTEWIPRRF